MNLIKVSLICCFALLLGSCVFVNECGLSSRYYNDCKEYYDIMGVYHKDCQENNIANTCQKEKQRKCLDCY